ncbi:E3 ubiquitin-protein ligase DTX3L [Babesia microti strain RI]|uniref:RING-type E3 ubiquitin transferase n=1 Tax=Babesia microti (strain RI) TaxID=1133968 RepID=A0A1N6LX38_BABMR|nr:E3 ubiquitin-protein ligase DTX3L [Babesia microti strain RI]SIO73435.1 E3 ubiquitin-protein ligase DTX3L [Babesia microti strain RI]|eukprot:XP_021337534.1 E3 ubiquitin-protein ligase DTX3L [Babesia microti strain RI]
MASKLSLHTLARIEDAKPKHQKAGSDDVIYNSGYDCDPNSSHGNNLRHYANATNISATKNGSYDEKNGSSDSEPNIIDVLKSHKYKGSDPFPLLNIDYSMNMINLDWWRMGRATYGFEMDQNCIQIVDRSTQPSPSDPNEVCPVCIDNLASDVVALNGCSHKFHRVCIIEYKNNEKYGKCNLVCPLCSIISLPGRGPSPCGTMSWRLSNKHFMLDRNEVTGVLTIKYTIRSGTQMKCHPHPGSPYSGGQFKAYLPLTDDYISLLKLFIMAFLDGQTFTVKSMPIGQSHMDVVVWNLEHKYNLHGGLCNFGYPDLYYLERASSQVISILNNGR